MSRFFATVSVCLICAPGDERVLYTVTASNNIVIESKLIIRKKAWHLTATSHQIKIQAKESLLSIFFVVRPEEGDIKH